MDETTENFWAAMATWEAPPALPINYRLYYNDRGQPLFYTMEDLPGNYIEVDKDLYLRSPMNVRIQDLRVIEITPQPVFNKLKPSTTGTSCHPTNVSVVVDYNTPHIKWSNNVVESN